MFLFCLFILFALQVQFVNDLLNTFLQSIFFRAGIHLANFIKSALVHEYGHRKLAITLRVFGFANKQINLDLDGFAADMIEQLTGLIDFNFLVVVQVLNQAGRLH